MKTTPDWFGNISVYRPSYELTVEKGVLRFQYRAEKKATCDESLETGQFVEGLWEQDVAEFFVAGVDGTDYQEINISPTGAWWSAYFSAYRALDREVEFSPQITATRSEDSWDITFETEVENFIPWRGANQRLFSAASILYDPEPNYFAWNHPPGDDEPDFHRRDLFLTL